MNRTYKVVKLDRLSIANDELWTVVQYKDGVCTGGDHHWVRERYAERAKLIYEAGYHAHHWHSTPASLAKVYVQLTKGEPMFDEDPPCDPELS